ncbi:MAG: tryptophan-rich sensory protein [Ruminococcaceae bacterium]|nr:tryptophan-rich sensory protein [Oscillospiraceae bacterium]
MFDYKKLIKSILLPLAAGGLSALLTMNSMDIYDRIVKPSLAPPGFLFPIVWTVLYVLMGISAFLIKTSDADSVRISSALNIYTVQLILNITWPLLFFVYERFTLSFIWLLLLLIAVIVMTFRFYEINKTAGLLQIPYIIWLIFAGYLNYMVSVLN